MKYIGWTITDEEYPNHMGVNQDANEVVALNDSGCHDFCDCHCHRVPTALEESENGNRQTNKQLEYKKFEKSSPENYLLEQ